MGGNLTLTSKMLIGNPAGLLREMRPLWRSVQVGGGCAGRVEVSLALVNVGRSFPISNQSHNRYSTLRCFVSILPLILSSADFKLWENIC